MKKSPFFRLDKKDYNKHFDNIIIICPTLQCNKTYPNKGWIRHYESAWLIEPKDKLYQWVEKLSLLLAGSQTLFNTMSLLVKALINV